MSVIEAPVRLNRPNLISLASAVNQTHGMLDALLKGKQYGDVQYNTLPEATRLKTAINYASTWLEGGGWATLNAWAEAIFSNGTMQRHIIDSLELIPGDPDMTIYSSEYQEHGEEGHFPVTLSLLRQVGTYLEKLSEDV